MFDDLLSQAAVAQALGVEPSTVHSWLRKGKLPHLEIGGRRFVRRADVAKFAATYRGPAEIRRAQ